MKLAATIIAFALSAQAAPKKYRVTAYCDKDRITYGNTIPRERHTIAAPRYIPIGTRVRVTIPGLFTNRVYRVEDRTHKRLKHTWDIFNPDCKACKNFGVRTGLVEILR